jgi:hypothetical protein
LLGRQDCQRCPYWLHLIDVDFLGQCLLNGSHKLLLFGKSAVKTVNPFNYSGVGKLLIHFVGLACRD